MVKQTARGKLQDRKRNAKRQLPATKENVTLWKMAPNRIDIIGVDTKKNGKKNGKKPIKTKRKTTKKTTSKGPQFKVNPGLLDRNTLRSSYAWSSHSPDKRAKQEEGNFKQEVSYMYKELYKHAKTPQQKARVKKEMNSIQKKYAEMYNKRLAAHGRIASSMVVGPAKFNVAQNNKRISAYEKQVKQMNEWRKKVVSKIKSEFNKENIAAAGGVKAIAAKKAKSAAISHEMQKKANVVIRSKVSMADKQKALVKFGFSPSVAKDVLSSGATFSMQRAYATKKRAAEREEILKRKEETKTSIESFPGGKLKDNKEVDRVQILFDKKPDAAMISKLKGAGWRWSPKNSAWQRQRTPRAMYSAKQILGMKY